MTNPTVNTSRETVLEVARAVLLYVTERGQVPTAGHSLWWWNRLVEGEADGLEAECFVVLSHCLEKAEADWKSGRFSERAEGLDALLARIRAALARAREESRHDA